MDHYAPRKYRGPGTWALVRDAYLAGETGPIVAARYDVGLANLRLRARKEGWTRADLARAADRAPAAARADPTPGAPTPARPALSQAAPAPPRAESAADPVRAALDHAAAQLAAGRGAEAAATLKAAEALRRLQADLEAAASAPSADQTEASSRRRAVSPEEEVARWEALREMIEARADALARGLLQSQFPGVPAVHSPFVLHWRALHLGPEAARRDREHATHAGWARRVYTAEGALRPLPDLLADERRRLWNGLADRDLAPDDEPPSLAQTPDPLPPDPNNPPPEWTGPIVREL